MDISQFGKGALETPAEIKADHFRLAAFAAPVIDWNKPRRPRDLPVANQHQASDCTAEATVKYGQNKFKRILNRIEDWSRRHIYSQVFGPEGGAYIWAAMGIPIKQNFVSEASVPAEDYSETTMRDRSKNAGAVGEALPQKYAQLTNTRDMDYLASIIDIYGGFVTGFNGRNDMFDQNGVANIPQTVDWGHAVFVYDYGVLPSGEKVLIFINSWSDQWGDQGYGYFPESFIKNGPIFDLYTYASIEDIDPTSMNNRFVTTEGSKDVWLVKDGKRSLIYNALAFTLVSGEWGKIEKITQEQLNALPDTGKVLAGLEQE